MPAGVVLGSLYAAIKALLAADATLVALLATKTLGGAPGIYDDGAVPQTSTMPYLTIGAGTQVARHTMGSPVMARYGWNCTLQVKAVGQGSESAGLSILDAVGAVLYEGRELTVAGYSMAYVDEWSVFPTIITTLAGVTTREWPAIVRCQLHD